MSRKSKRRRVVKEGQLVPLVTLPPLTSIAGTVAGAAAKATSKKSHPAKPKKKSSEKKVLDHDRLKRETIEKIDAFKFSADQISQMKSDLREFMSDPHKGIDLGFESKPGEMEVFDVMFDESDQIIDDFTSRCNQMLEEAKLKLEEKNRSGKDFIKKFSDGCVKPLINEEGKIFKDTDKGDEDYKPDQKEDLDSEKGHARAKQEMGIRKSGKSTSKNQNTSEDIFYEEFSSIFASLLTTPLKSTNIRNLYDPPKQLVKSFYDNWYQWILFVVENEEIISSVCSMQYGKGLPEMGKLEELWGWVNEIARDDQDTAKKIFSSVTGMMTKKGLPDLDHLKGLWEWVYEISNADLDAAKRMFSSITGMMRGKTLPEVEKLEELWKWLNEVTGENPEAAKSLLSSITSMMNSKGLPEMNKLKELQGWVDKIAEKDPEATRKIFSSIAGMMNGKDLPDVKKLQELWDWTNEIAAGSHEATKRVFFLITGTTASKGLPDMEKLKQDFDKEKSDLEHGTCDEGDPLFSLKSEIIEELRKNPKSPLSVAREVLGRPENSLSKYNKEQQQQMRLVKAALFNIARQGKTISSAHNQDIRALFGEDFDLELGDIDEDFNLSVFDLDTSSSSAPEAASAEPPVAASAAASAAEPADHSATHPADEDIYTFDMGGGEFWNLRLPQSTIEEVIAENVRGESEAGKNSGPRE